MRRPIRGERHLARIALAFLRASNIHKNQKKFWKPKTTFCIMSLQAIIKATKHVRKAQKQILNQNISYLWLRSFGNLSKFAYPTTSRVGILTRVVYSSILVYTGFVHFPPTLYS
jgi:hypothetical protein